MCPVSVPYVVSFYAKIKVAARGNWICVTAQGWLERLGYLRCHWMTMMDAIISGARCSSTGYSREVPCNEQNSLLARGESCQMLSTDLVGFGRTPC